MSGGGEQRIQAGAKPSTEYSIPADVDWSAAWLQWADGTRASLPLPHGPHAEVIELRPRRFARSEPPPEDGWRGEIAPPVRDALGAASRTVPEAGETESPVSAGVASHGEPEADVSPSPAEERATHVPASSVSPGAPSPEGANGVAAGETAAGPSWTTPPQLSDSTAEAEAVWRERRDDLRRELSEAADAIARARDGERSARDAVLTALAAARADLRASRAAREADTSALAAVTGELGAERAAHAVTRGSVGSLADALSTARAELAAAKTRGEATQADLAVARAELAAAKATGAAELAEARSEATRARAEAASLREALEAERAHRERPVPGRGDLGRLAREQAEVAAAARRSPEASAQLLANLDAAAAALRAATPTADPASGPEPAGETVIAPPDSSAAETETARVEGEATQAPDGAGAGLAGNASLAGSSSRAEGLSGRADALSRPADGLSRRAQPADVPGPTEAVPGPPRAETPASSALVASSVDRRLRNVLVALAREDSVAAGALLVGLLPAQGAVIATTLTYDVTVRGVGTFAVFVADGSARIVRLSRRRPRGQALFHLSAEPLVLAELLAGERGKVGRFRRRARISGRRKRARELLLLADAQLSVADAARAGARLEPGLIYRALPLAVDPEWTRGHSFTVAQQIIEFAPHAWHITARDGQPLRVVQRHADASADATVTMSQAAFERMLRNEPPALGDRPQIRGDREAVAALKRWTDLVRGA